MTRVGLIRHGITDWNIERRAQGHTDIPLNSEGLNQAEKLAKRLMSEPWDVIYSSDLSRAYLTAQKIADHKGMKITADQRLREMYCGLIEGTIEEDRINKWGADWRSLDLDIEKDEEVATRGYKVFTDIAANHPNQNVLIVSHGALIGFSLKKLIPHVNTQAHLGNTSLTILTSTNNEWDCERYNCTEHVKG
ncbi:histidine phosphatase family protein [Paenibacillus sp. N1-5-1-14]|uniref:histidine phosphatase family protein n=1 Tax=Paenibacillus radicibacter TaxID=2972488 RepID=UPI002158B07C|nr:histidine phosphatase family protein [Paenibacillus radicibacter]MCR8644419.1 histidine phosphatase family protein [Paenibacillus radicibacter]